jgi:hypothetical protein
MVVLMISSPWKTGGMFKPWKWMLVEVATIVPPVQGSFAFVRSIMLAIAGIAAFPGMAIPAWSIGGCAESTGEPGRYVIRFVRLNINWSPGLSRKVGASTSPRDD